MHEQIGAERFDHFHVQRQSRLAENQAKLKGSRDEFPVLTGAAEIGAAMAVPFGGPIRAAAGATRLARAAALGKGVARHHMAAS